MTKEQAIKEAKELLRDHANELACIAHTKLWDELPHNVRVAIQREIQRIRKITDVLFPEEGAVFESPYECYWRDRAQKAEKQLEGESAIEAD